MNQAVKKYRKRLEKRLCCGHEARKRLLGQFDRTLQVYLEDYPDPNMDDLCSAFGLSKQMAQELMNDVSAEEYAKWRRNCRLRRVFSCLAAVVLLLVCAGIIFYMKQPVVIQEQETVVIGSENESLDHFRERTGDQS